MRRHYFFKKGDLVKWYKAYTKSEIYVKTYRYYLSDKRKVEEKDKYCEAKEIVNEYKVFISSLNKIDRQYFDEFIKTGKISEYELKKYHPEILENFELIVLNSNKHNLKDIDLKILGSELKELREDNSFYRVEAARYLNISDRTLESYEEGTREISINIFYKLIQLYEVSDITDFFNSVYKI